MRPPAGHGTLRSPHLRWSTLLLIGLAACLLGAKRRSRQGTLMVQSATVGAMIYVDGEFVAEVPMSKPLRLKAGQHTVKVTKPGHADYIDTFRVRKRKRTLLEIDLLPVAGVLHIASKPSGATVVIDGRALGETPYNGELQPGERVVELRLEGHTAFRRAFTVSAGAIYPLEAELIPMLELPPEALETPWYGHWWVWAGAAVVVGGVTAAVLMSGEDDAPPDPDILLEIEPIR